MIHAWFARWRRVPTSEATDINTDVVKIQPAEGLMLMFPAWLTHGVEQNVSEHESGQRFRSISSCNGVPVVPSRRGRRR